MEGNMGHALEVSYDEDAVAPRHEEERREDRIEVALAHIGDALRCLAGLPLYECADIAARHGEHIATTPALIGEREMQLEWQRKHRLLLTAAMFRDIGTASRDLGILAQARIADAARQVTRHD
jgi:hypothetical protein